MKLTISSSAAVLILGAIGCPSGCGRGSVTNGCGSFRVMDDEERANHITAEACSDLIDLDAVEHQNFETELSL